MKSKHIYPLDIFRTILMKISPEFATVSDSQLIIAKKFVFYKEPLKDFNLSADCEDTLIYLSEIVEHNNYSSIEKLKSYFDKVEKSIFSTISEYNKGLPKTAPEKVTFELPSSKKANVMIVPAYSTQHDTPAAKRRFLLDLESTASLNRVKSRKSLKKCVRVISETVSKSVRSLYLREKAINISPNKSVSNKRYSDPFHSKNNALRYMKTAPEKLDRIIS